MTATMARPDRAQFLAAREAQKGWGGSDAAACCDLDRYKSRYTLVCEAIGLLPRDQSDSDAAEIGRECEDGLVRIFEARTGMKVRRHALKPSTKHTFMYGNIDRQILTPSGEIVDTLERQLGFRPSGPGVMEAKFRSHWTGFEDESRCPDEPYLQMQHYLEVFGYSWGCFAVAVGNTKFSWFAVGRKDSLIAELVRQERETRELVDAKQLPPVDGSESTANTLRRLYPTHEDTEITLDSYEARRDFELAFGVRADLKRLGLIKDESDNSLKSMIGSAGKAVIPGVGHILWRQSKDREVLEVDARRTRLELPHVWASLVEAGLASEKVVPGARPFLVRSAKSDE